MQAGAQTLLPEISALPHAVRSCPVHKFVPSLITASIVSAMPPSLTFRTLLNKVRRQLHTQRLVWGLSAIIMLNGRVTAGDELVEKEFWFTISFDNQPVGFEHVKVRPVTDQPTSLLSCFRKTELNLTRLNQNLTVKASLWTTQTPSGILQTFHLQRTDGNGSRIERSGTVSSDGSQLRIKEKVAATRRTYDVRIPSGTRSPIVSLWLPQIAEAAQGRITVPVFFPESSVTSDITAGRMPNRRLRLFDNQQLDAKRFQFALQLDPANLTELLTDESANVVRQEKQVLNRTLVLQATTAEQALNAASDKSLDLDAVSLIPIKRLPAAGTGRKVAVLELSVTEGFLPAVPSTSYQAVEPISSSVTRITFSESRPKQRRVPISAAPPEPLPPTRWMPTDHAALQRMALFAAGSETEPATVCRKLETFVRQKMRYSAFSTTLLPADEVARTLKGDCTEHAILLATLIRIRGIPTRIASGLIHTNRQLGFTGHVWVEATINDRWEPFDSAVDNTAAGTTRIKLSDSEMPDEVISGVSLFLPILELAGRAQVQIIRARWNPDTN